MPQVQAWLEEWFGERCPDYCEECILCNKWAAFDELFGEFVATYNTTQPNDKDTPK